MSCLHLVYNLFSPDLLQRVRDKRQDSCTDKDGVAFQLPAGWSVLNEIGKSFSIARASWYHFTASGHTNIKPWAHTLLKDVLGYQLDECPAEGIPADRHAADDDQPVRLYPITYIAGPEASYVIPVLVVPATQDLDKSMDFGDGLKQAPARLMQQFLNESGRFLWALVTNGTTLRLMRDNPALSRPCYLEADMYTMLSAADAVAFDTMWRLMHSSRAMLRTPGEPTECLWEDWRKELEEQGSRARDGLRDGVERALCALGTGFLHGKGPGNDELRAALREGRIDANDFYQELMRTVYRLIFLSVTEDRDWIHAHDRRLTTAAKAYDAAYSLSRLVDRALNPDDDERFHDLWEAQRIVFKALASNEPQRDLALPALGGLFAEDQCPHLNECVLSNKYFLLALRHLRWFRADRSAAFSRVDYRYMGAEELGSVYESLLELTPVLSPELTSFYLQGGCEDPNKARGNARKSTGSYYTPTCLVEQVLNTALNPLLEKCGTEGELLRLRVIDPACGSGHFLLGAARRMAETLAALRASGPYTQEDFLKAMHDVVSRCIYGVDINPMAIELVRMNLWLEGYQPGKPLSFLDHHLQAGNSLLGIIDTKCLSCGIPSDAYKPLAGDDKEICKELKKNNTASVNHLRNGKRSLALASHERPADLEQMPEYSPAEVRAKERAWINICKEQERDKQTIAADVWVGAFLLPKTPGANIPTTLMLEGLANGLTSIDEPAVAAARDACRAAGVFHWPMRFPEAMADGGFHCVLGNPPWEKIKLQEKEYFSARCPAIATASNASTRTHLIQLLKEGNMTHHQEETEGAPVPWEQALFRKYEASLRLAGAESLFYHTPAQDGGRFPLTGVGDVNLYALFAELDRSLRRPAGRAGFIVPTGIATDDSTKAFFQSISQGKQLESLYDFENKELFPDVHKSFKFSLITLSSAEQADFAYYLIHPRELADKRRRFTMTAKDFALINPNTGTCPLFRCREDARLCQKLYRHAPVLMREDTETNPWGIKFCRLLDMSNDSGLFLTEPEDGAMPLYEGKMIHLYDHRWASFTDTGGDADAMDATPEEHAASTWEPAPRYWVRRADVLSHLPKGIATAPRWLLGFRDITNATNERTFVCSLFPFVGVGNTLPLIFSSNGHVRSIACLAANLSSLVLDYVARIKVGGTHMNFHYVKQLPVLPPDAYSPEDQYYIHPRMLELCYTSESMRPWAEDMGYKGNPFPWDTNRRAILRAELDARIAKLYGLTREELNYILDPTSVFGDDCPTQTFPGLRRNEEKLYSEYRTRRLVLEAWDADA
ncbi:Eco57I restriction-modification methylase domain-containing protein [Akkermansia sp. AKK6]